MKRTRAEATRRTTGALACVAASLATAAALATTPAEAAAPAGTITTVAGGVGGPAPATEIPFDSPFTCGTAQFAAGHLLIADQNGGVVREINPRTDWLRTPAGNGQAGYTGDGGPATSAELNVPCAATIDHAGNLVIADKDNGRVRVVAAKTGTFYGQHMSAGDIYTVMSGDADCQVAESSGWFCPVDVIADRNGNVLVSNEGSEDPRGPSATQIIAIAERSGTFYGKNMQAGGNYLLTNGGGAQLAVDQAGNILAAVGTEVTVLAERTGRFYGLAMKTGHDYVVAGTGGYGQSGDGGPARKAKLAAASAVAVTQAGNVIVGDSNANQIRVVAVKTGTFYGRSMKAGDIYQIAGVRKGLTSNGVPAAKAAVNSPHSIAVDGAGNIVLGEDGDARVIAVKTGTFYRQHLKAGDIYTIAGSGIPYAGEGGPATSAQLAGNGAGGVASDQAGNLLVAHGVLRVVPASTGTFYGQSMTKGDIYTVAGGGTGPLGDAGPAKKANLDATDVAVDAAGNLVVTDPGSERVRVVATHTGTFYGQSMTAGDIYTVAGDGASGFTGDGGPATSAELSDPQGIAVDQAGNLVFVDAGNSRLRVVAARNGTFYGQSMTAGDIYPVAGNGSCDSGPAGIGGPALSAELCVGQSSAVAVDASGNLVLSSDGAVLVVAVASGTYYGQTTSAGNVYEVAGYGGPAGTTGLRGATGVAVDGHGNLIISTGVQQQVLVLAAANGTFYGVPMTTGGFYVVAGNGQLGMAGDGGPATNAELAYPAWITIDHAGNLLVDDSGNHRVRMIEG